VSLGAMRSALATTRAPSTFWSDWTNLKGFSIRFLKLLRSLWARAGGRRAMEGERTWRSGDKKDHHHV
jgi:hypothetical protein